MAMAQLQVRMDAVLTEFQVFVEEPYWSTLQPELDDPPSRTAPRMASYTTSAALTAPSALTSAPPPWRSRACNPRKAAREKARRASAEKEEIHGRLPVSAVRAMVAGTTRASVATPLLNWGYVGDEWDIKNLQGASGTADGDWEDLGDAVGMTLSYTPLHTMLRGMEASAYDMIIWGPMPRGTEADSLLDPPLAHHPLTPIVNFRLYGTPPRRIRARSSRPSVQRLPMALKPQSRMPGIAMAPVPRSSWTCRLLRKQSQLWTAQRCQEGKYRMSFVGSGEACAKEAPAFDTLRRGVRQVTEKLAGPSLCGEEMGVDFISITIVETGTWDIREAHYFMVMTRQTVAPMSLRRARRG